MTGFLKQFLIPIGFIVLLALATLWGGLFMLTTKQNQQEKRREIELVMTVQTAKLDSEWARRLNALLRLGKDSVLLLAARALV